MAEISRMINVTAERIFRYIPIYSVKLSDISCNYLETANVPITDWLVGCKLLKNRNNKPVLLDKM